MPGFLDRFNASMMNFGQNITQGLQINRKNQLAQAEEEQAAKMAPLQQQAAEQAVKTGNMDFENRLKTERLFEGLRKHEVRPTSEFTSPNELQPGQQGPVMLPEVRDVERGKEKSFDGSKLEKQIFLMIDQKNGLGPGTTEAKRDKISRGEGGSKTGKYGLKVEFGRGKDNEKIPMRMSPGGLERLELPEGVEGMASGFDKVDMGGYYDFYDTEGNYKGSKSKTLKPGERPSVKGEQAKEVAAGTLEGGEQISPKKKKAAGKKQVTNYVKVMVDHFKNLDKAKGIVSTEAGAIGNIGRSASSSDLGQWAAGKIGSKTQSTREKIKAMKPNLINALRMANPSIGSKGMDTPKEMEFYLSAIGNEKKDVQSNYAALKVFNDAYGFGIDIPSSPGMEVEVRKLKNEFKRLNGEVTTTPDKPAGLTDAEWEELQELENEYGN